MPERPSSRRVEIPQTERLQRVARSWRGAPMPDAVVTPGPGQESVWDYPRPPAVERVEVRVEVFVGDDRIADSVRCLRVLETAGPPTVYFPPGDVRTDALRSAAGGSICEWKGAASYFRLADAVGAGAPVGWRYERPFPEYAVLAGYVSFYPGRVTRCVYGGDAVRPQPGRFYGGWITPNLVGPFKGEPGSEGW